MLDAEVRALVARRAARRRALEEAAVRVGGLGLAIIAAYHIWGWWGSLLAFGLFLVGPR